MGRVSDFFNYLSRVCSDMFYRSSAGLSASFRKELSLDDEGYDGVGIEREVDRELAGLSPDFSRNPRDLYDDEALHDAVMNLPKDVREGNGIAIFKIDDERKPAKRVILIDGTFIEEVLSSFIQVL